MTHFAVMVKVKATKLAEHNGDLESAIEELMEPYIESGTGHCKRQYEEFIDTEGKWRKEYNEDKVDVVVMPDGELVFTCDDRFKQKVDNSFDYKFVIPQELEQREASFEEIYGTFEIFTKDWHGSEKLPNGKYGYWNNPNSHYDYWRIGGRWRGQLIVKAGVAVGLGELGYEYAPRFNDSKEYIDKPCRGDYAQVQDIDFEAIEHETDERIKDWWERYQKDASASGFDNWDIQDFLVKSGVRIVPCENQAEIDEWRKNGSNGNYPTPIWRHTREITLDELLTTFRWYWDPLRTYAVCDEDGWHSPGEMGWWGIDCSERDDFVSYGSEFRGRFIDNELPDTTLVICDCHVQFAFVYTKA